MKELNDQCSWQFEIKETALFEKRRGISDSFPISINPFQTNVLYLHPTNVTECGWITLA